MIFLAHIFSPVLGLMVNVISQIIMTRYVKKFGLLTSVILGFLVGLAIVFTIEIAHTLTSNSPISEVIGALALNTITYGALGYCYFHFVNLGETARRVRIVRELLDSKDGLSMSEIFEHYDASEIIRVRLQRLLKNKQITLRNDRYFITKSMLLYITKIIIMMKIALLRKTSEINP
jgi:hypothetical protein